jgi:thioredoxin reductase (NADPH)
LINLWDVIIIGKGPAGISAALYTVRANLKTLIVGGNDSAIAKSQKIDNYYGFEESITGMELLMRGEAQVLRVGAEILTDQVLKVDWEGNFFTVNTATDSFHGRSVLLATGQSRKKVDIGGIDEFEGRGVSYCTTCDGFFYKGLEVGVVGSSDYAYHEANELKTFTNKLTIFTNGQPLELQKYADFENLKINSKRISHLSGDEFLREIYFDDGTYQEIDGLFIAGESASALDFARKMGVNFNKNDIVVDSEQQTNIKKLFAAGDCTGGFKQIATAVGQGALASKKIIEVLRKE